MIKSELIKQQIELIRISKIQKEVKKELEDEENQDKDEDKKKKEDNEEDKKDNEEKKQKDNRNIPGDEPNGSEV